MAGPITVAAVAATVKSKFQNTNSKQIKNFKLLKNIKDSKQLSAIQREEWSANLKTWETKHGAFAIAVSSVGPQVIDRVGITRAARQAVERCLRKLAISYKPYAIRRKTYGVRHYNVLLDGSLYAPRTYQNQETIIKGDEKIPLIAAASIIAKVHRDKIMTRLHKKFPQYGFDAHKGYGTKAHKAAIKEHGLSPIHRKSFRV